MCWFSGQCPNLDNWLKDSPVAELINVIAVFELGNNLIYIEFTAAAHQFSIITTSEIMHYPTIMSFTFSDRDGNRPMYKGDYNKASWCKIEADILSVIQDSTHMSGGRNAHLSDVTGND